MNARRAAAASCLFAAAAVLSASSPWSSIGPPGGILELVAVSPSDPNVVYVASVIGGVFRSDDGGTTFNPAIRGLAAAQVLCLAVAPDDASVVYAGASAGGFKSTDGGATWTPLGGGFPSALINTMVVDPSHSSTVYAGGATGTLVKSVDSGASWTAIGGTDAPSAQPRILAIAPGSTSTLYLGTLQKGFYRSTDGGSTWSNHNDGFLFPEPAIFTIAADPTRASRVYAAVSADVYFSDNAGDHWQLDDGQSGFVTSVGALAVDAAGVVFVADQIAFYTQPPGAADWTPIVGADRFVNFIAVGPSPAPPVFLAHGRAGLSAGGLDRWDGGSQFTVSAPTAESISALAADPVQAGRILAAATIGILAHSGGAGGAWTPVQCCVGSAVGNIATAIVFDPRTAGLVYASTGAGVFRSTDGGATFVASSNGIPSTVPATVVRSLLPQPGTASGMFAGTSKGLYQSPDGMNWTAGSGDLSSRQVIALAADSASPSTLWAGTDDGVYRSMDTGAHWTKTAASLGGTVHAVLSVSGGSGRVLAGADSGLYASTDGGTTWTSVPGVGATVNALARDPSSGVIAAGTLAGVFESSDAGASWSAAHDGLTNPSVLSLVYLPDGTLLAGTSGGSVFGQVNVHTVSRGPVTRAESPGPPRSVPPRS
ncbi:MAG: WD40/YVTN/BNR-like repeat-containing protein [Syntrophomonadaceae bacterium]